jgi:hypothetical protein
MKQADDNKTIDMLGLKRGRGKPKGDTPALTSAQRQAARVERLRASGVDFLKVQLPVDVLDALDKFAASKDRAKVETKSQVIERLIRSSIMRKR